MTSYPINFLIPKMFPEKGLVNSYFGQHVSQFLR